MNNQEIPRSDKLRQQGLSCLQHNQPAEARKCFHDLCKLNPNDAHAWYTLGSIHAMLGQFKEAEPCCRKALAIHPSHGPSHYNLGVVLQRMGDPDGAIQSYHKALEQLPQLAVIHSSLGYALWEMGKLEESATSCKTALAIDPDLAEAWNNLSITQQSMGQQEQAVDSCLRALKIRPDYAEVYNNLGNCLSDLSSFSEATKAYMKAIQINPVFDQAHVGLGKLYNDIGEYQSAISEYQHAIKINQNNTDAHFNLAWTLLSTEKFEQGWQEYEWRLRLKLSKPITEYPEPLWDGKPLYGKTIFIQAEQGFGDAIQFVRYIPLIKQLGGKVILECPTELCLLFSTRNDIDRIIARGERPPRFDCRIPLASLPRAFKTTLENLPADIPYLSPTGKCPHELKSLLTGHAGKKRIGLVWSGNPDFQRNHLRSCPLELFKQLLDTPNTVFFSLQKGEAAKDLVVQDLDKRVIPLGDKLHTFSDTAAVLNVLDLLISTDTSVPHLAGAMGIPVWLLLSYSPDWRWLLGREDCPWYPSMRLFRQAKPNDWSSVLKQVGTALNNGQ